MQLGAGGAIEQDGSRFGKSLAEWSHWRRWNVTMQRAVGLVPKAEFLTMLTRQQARDFDRRAMDEFGVPGIVLMENAGRGVAETISRLGLPGPVLICCGKGNNAGDGLV